VPTGHKEALGFIAAPQNANCNAITKHTPDEKFEVAQIGLSEQAPYKGGIASKDSHKVWSQQGGDSKIKHIAQENIAQLPETTKHEIFA
jgi:hypothetical protein